MAVPGPAGEDGTDGVIGTNGQNAFTTFTAAFTMPAELGSAVATVGSTAWMSVGEILYAAKMDGSVIGYLQVTAIGGATSVTLLNLENTATGVYASNSAPASVFDIGSKLQPGGLQGINGIGGATAIAGDVTGTLAASTLTIAPALGSLPVGNGTKAASFVKGTDGQMLVTDAAATLDLAWKSTQPITGDADLDTDRVPRLSAATGLPIPLKSSRASIKDAGGAGTFVLDARTAVGNARGADAIDLQTARGALTQVAAAVGSVIGGGTQNTVDGAATNSVISGGISNQVQGVESVVGGGIANVTGAAATNSVISGGRDNDATAVQSTVGGGRNNLASGTNSTVPGGINNTASATAATVGGGSANAASMTGATAAGGESNTASGINSTVSGGTVNTASGEKSAIPGGYRAIADKYGQISHASGFFSVLGDAQVTELIWRLITESAAPNKPMFLDGASLLATMPTGKTWAFDIIVVGRVSAGASAAWQIKGAIQNNAGTVSLVSAVTTTVIADGTTGTWGVAANVVVSADNALKTLNIQVAVTTDPGVTARWVAHGRIVEVAIGA